MTNGPLVRYGAQAEETLDRMTVLERHDKMQSLKEAVSAGSYFVPDVAIAAAAISHMEDRYTR